MLGSSTFPARSLAAMRAHRFKPLASRTVQAAVGLPDVARPAANELRILLFSGGIANICNRHRAPVRQVVRPCQIDVPVQPARDLPIQPAVSGGFDAAAQSREMRDERQRSRGSLAAARQRQLIAVEGGSRISRHVE